jgi:hypothetical protein
MDESHVVSHDFVLQAVAFVSFVLYAAAVPVPRVNSLGLGAAFIACLLS